MTSELGEHSFRQFLLVAANPMDTGMQELGQWVQLDWRAHS